MNSFGHNSLSILFFVFDFLLNILVDYYDILLQVLNSSLYQSLLSYFSGHDTFLDDSIDETHVQSIHTTTFFTLYEDGNTICCPICRNHLKSCVVNLANKSVSDVIIQHSN